MIWNTLSPFYDFFETAYNGKCFKGIAEEIRKYIGPDDIVLECACGTGLLTVPMASKCKKLLATDYSAGMLRQTAKKLKGASNVKLRRMSLPDIPCKDGSFDVVVAANVIHLLDDPAAAFESMKRVCRPGGKIIVPTYINKVSKNAMGAAKLLSLMGVDFKQQFDLESYKAFIRSFEFTDVEYSVVDGRMPCAFAIIKNFPNR